MPMYDYQCAKCNHQTQRMANVDNRDKELQCAKCGAPMQRVMFPQDSKLRSKDGQNHRPNLPDVFRKI